MVKFVETERRMVGALGGGGRNGNLVFTGDRVSVWENEEVLEVSGGEGCMVL